jgi:hypothetical protein
MARTTPGTRILAALGIATLTMIGNGSATHAAPAPARSATYIAPGGVYHFTYPATWTEQHLKNLDVAVLAPDQNVVVTSLGVGGSITNSKVVLADVIKPIGTPVGKAQYRKSQLADGLTLREAITLVRTKDGKVGLQDVEFVSTGGRAYLLSGWIENVQAATKDKDVRQLAQIMSSFDVVSKPTK